MDARTLKLAMRIADDAARGLLLTETVPASEGDGWMDLSNVPAEAQAQLADALEYLEVRRLLSRREGNALQVRFTEPVLPN